MKFALATKPAADNVTPAVPVVVEAETAAQAVEIVRASVLEGHKIQFVREAGPYD